MVSAKRGWIRILEATIAVMLISGVLVIVYANQSQGSNVGQSELSNLQKRVLQDVTTLENLRNSVLSENITEINRTVSGYVPSHLGYSIKICELSKPCKLDAATFKETLSKNVVAQSAIVSSNVTQYSPKKVMLFLWYR